MLRDNINNLISESMKAHDAVKTRTLRFIKAELLKASTMSHKDPAFEEYSESLEIRTLLKMVSDRNKSIESYTNRPDLQKNEQEEIDIIKTFLPKEVPSMETAAIVYKTIHTMRLNNEHYTLKDIITKVSFKYPMAAKKDIISSFQEYSKKLDLIYALSKETDTNNKIKYIFEIISTFEYNAGESFADYFEDSLLNKQIKDCAAFLKAKYPDIDFSEFYADVEEDHYYGLNTIEAVLEENLDQISSEDFKEDWDLYDKIRYCLASWIASDDKVLKVLLNWATEDECCCEFVVDKK